MYYEAEIYGKKIVATSLPTIKRLASVVANRNFNTVDTLRVIGLSNKGETLGSATFVRRNKKTPDNTIVRGHWSSNQ